jgi:4-amino-4-deoxy-L-arabinose transferase-like glycosyltransferase
VALVTLVALGLRVWQLQENLRIFVDEANFAAAVGLPLATNDVDLLVPMSSQIAFPWLYPYLQSFWVELFGRNLVGLRLLSAIIGALTIPALYWFMRSFADKATSFVAIILLATFPPHIHFSRLGMNNIADPLPGTLMLAFFLWGLRTSRPRYFALAGAFLGLTQYFYEGGRLLYPPLMIGFSVVLILLQPRKARQILPGIGLTFLLGLIIGLPIYYTLIGNNIPLTTRMDLVAVDGTGWQGSLTTIITDPQWRLTFLDKIRAAFFHFIKYPDQSGFYGGETPLLLSFMLPFFLIGVATLVRQLRHPVSLLLLLWLIATIAGNGLVRDSIHSTRYVVAIPALVVVTSIGIGYALPLIGRSIPAMPIASGSVAMLALAIVLGFGQINYYGREHLPYVNVQLRDRGTPDYVDAIFRALNFPKNTQIHFLSEFWIDGASAAGVAGFMAPYEHQLVPNIVSNVSLEYLQALPQDVDHAFFIERGFEETLAPLISQVFEVESLGGTPFDIPENRDFLLYYFHASPAAEGEQG